MRKVLNDQMEIDVRHYLEQWARWPTVLRSSSSGYNGTVIGRLVSGKRMRVCTLCEGERRIPGKRVGVKHPIIVCPRCNGEGNEAATLDTDGRQRLVRCEVCKPAEGDSTARPGEINGRTCVPCRGSGWRRLLVEACDCQGGKAADGSVCGRCKGSTIAPVKEHLVHPATISGTRYYGANTDPDPVSALLDRTIAGWAQSNLTYWLNAVVLMEYRCEYLGRAVGVGLTQGDKAEVMRVSDRWYRRNLTEAHRRVETLLCEFFTRTIDGDVPKSL